MTDSLPYQDLIERHAERSLDPVRDYRSEASVEEVKGILMTGALLGLLQTLMDDRSASNEGAETGRIPTHETGGSFE